MPSQGHQVTVDDVGPAINVMSWFLASTTFVAVALRSLTKSFVSRLTIDDLLILLSLILSLAVSVCDSMQVNHGLGRRFSTLSDYDLAGFEKAAYAGDLLYILVLVIAKISVLYFYQNLTPVPAHRRIIKLMIPLLALWGAMSFLVATFQCKAPETWNFLQETGGRCINRSAFSVYFNVTNMLVEFGLVAFPIYIIAKIQTRTSKKMLIVSCFLTRLLVIVALLCEIATRSSANLEADYTFNYWPVIISKQLTHSLSVITACIPYYISWVPNAFRIYANTYSHHAARLWKFNGGSDQAYEMEHGDPTRGGLSSIRKTVEMDVQVETASQLALPLPPKTVMTRVTTRYVANSSSSEQSSVATHY